MPKDKLTDYSATNASNTDVGGVNIDEGMLPSAVNNSIRELMTHLKNFSDGTDAIDALTVTGDLTVDTNTLHVDAANNRVGVGLTTPERVLHVNAGTNNNCALFESTDANADIYLQDSGATGNTSVGLRGQSNDLVFITNASETARLLSGGGLTFNGDTAAANALDDYEEGSFTPTITFGGGSTGMTFTAQNGRYTKIGNMCTVYVEMNLSNKGSSTGSVVYGGLPFTAASDIQDRAVTLQMFRDVPSGSNNLAHLFHVFPQNNQSGCILRSTISTGDAGPDDSDYDNNTRVSYTLTYKTA